MEDSGSELVSLIIQIDNLVERERETNLTALADNMNVVPSSQRTSNKIVSFTSSMYLESELLYVISQMIYGLRDASKPHVKSHFIALASELTHLVNNVLDMDSNPELKIISLIKQIIYLSKSASDSLLVSHATKMISIITSVDWDPKESEEELMSLTYQVASLLTTMDPDSELVSLITQIHDLVEVKEQRELESKLISFITQLMFHTNSRKWISERDLKVTSLSSRIISLVNSMEPKPESELMSLVNQTIFLFISLVSQNFSLVNSTDLESESDSDGNYVSHFDASLRLEPEPEIISLIYQIFLLVISMNPEWEKLISFIPELEVILRDGKFQVDC